jgi:hypothetical protein
MVSNLEHLFCQLRQGLSPQRTNSSPLHLPRTAGTGYPTVAPSRRPYGKTGGFYGAFHNKYKYGLGDLHSYMSATGEEQLERQYYEREVIYLLGDEDSDPNAPDLDTSCAAMLQGIHRLERGIIYNFYLLHYFGHDIMNRHTNAIVEGVGHSANAMFNSGCGIRYLFDVDPNGECGDPKN